MRKQIKNILLIVGMYAIVIALIVAVAFAGKALGIEEFKGV